MGKHEKAPQIIGVPQFAELAACVLKQLPRDIDSDIAQQWIKEPKALSKVLRDALCPPFSALERVRMSGYLDTSFDGKEVHKLTILPLTKEEAIAEYRASGGKTWVWDELEENMPYATPKVEKLDVMNMDFGWAIEDDDALAEMDKLGVRPLIYEELIQYGIVHPDHQRKNDLRALGSKHILGPGHYLQAPALGFGVVGRSLRTDNWHGSGDSRCRFLVVPK